MNINELIKNAMKEKGINTIRDLAILTGLSQNNLYKITEKKDVNVSNKTAKKLNEILNLNIKSKTRKNDGSVGYKIFKLRSDRNMSADKLSLLASLSISTVWSLERNEFKAYELTLKKLAKAFNMEYYELRKILFEN